MTKDVAEKNDKEPLYVDYKDVVYLRRFINPHGRIMASRRNNVSSERQRALAEAIKRARFMALLPFVAR